MIFREGLFMRIGGKLRQHGLKTLQIQMNKSGLKRSLKHGEKKLEKSKNRGRLKTQAKHLS